MSQGSGTETMPVSTAAILACIWEATSPKPGNVHRGADFEDVSYVDFLQSAVVVGPILARTAEIGVGRAVLQSVRATREAVSTNTNLGTLLLIAPLAMARDGTRHGDEISRVLRALSMDDTRHVYAAIRESSAGGLGRVGEADVSNDPPPTLSLVGAMQMASERDLVARQYCNQFADVFRIADWIEGGVARGWQLTTAIVYAHLRQLAEEHDSLILRKCGSEIAEQARIRAARVVDAGLPGNEAYERELENLDFWLRSDGHRRNPGTTADLIAAALFVLLRERRVKLKSHAHSHGTHRGGDA